MLILQQLRVRMEGGGHPAAALDAFPVLIWGKPCKNTSHSLDLFILFYVHILRACVYGHRCVTVACRGQKKVLDPLEQF